VLQDYIQAVDSKETEATSTQARRVLGVFAKEKWLSLSGKQQRLEAGRNFTGIVWMLALLAYAVWYFRESEWFWTVAFGATFFGGACVFTYVREIYQHSRWLREERDDLRWVLKLPPRQDITDLEVK
jgi:hypothetical protein